MKIDAAAAQLGWDDETVESEPIGLQRAQLEEELFSKIPTEHLQILIRAYEAGALRLSLVRWEKHEDCHGRGCAHCSGGQYQRSEFLPLRSPGGGAQ